MKAKEKKKDQETKARIANNPNFDVRKSYEMDHRPSALSASTPWWPGVSLDRIKQSGVSNNKQT